MRRILQQSDRDNKRRSLKRAKRKNRHLIKKRDKINNICSENKQLSDRILVPYAIHIGSNNNRKSVVRFLSRLRQSALVLKRRVILDFSECSVINAPGMLLFVSELDRIKRILGSKFNVGIENSTNRLVDQVLYQLGVYELCSVVRSKRDSGNFDETVKHWRFATGQRANEETSRAFENFEGRLTTELAKGMWKSVSEAVVNSVEHAYVAPRGVNGARMGHSRWWMFSQERDGKLTVAVCDLGIGIPKSLPLNWQPGILRRVLDSLSDTGSDVRAIKAALKVGATSTGKGHRGKGLPQIWNTLRSSSTASISIMSNRGTLTWNGEKQEEFTVEHTTSIAGTIIMWTVGTKDSGDGDEG